MRSCISGIFKRYNLAGCDFSCWVESAHSDKLLADFLAAGASVRSVSPVECHAYAGKGANGR